MASEQGQAKPITIARNAFAVYAPMAMLAGMQLDVFTPLQNGPLSAAELARVLGVRTEKLEVLLYGLVYAELLTRKDDRFSNTPEADAYLVRGRTKFMGSIHELYSDLWGNLLKLAQSLREDRPQGQHDFAVMSDAELGAFFRGLHSGAFATGKQLAKRFYFERFNRLLDVGGGSGGVAIAACEACPLLNATILELPRVAPIAQSCVEEAGLSKRIAVVAGDILNGPPDGQFDAAVLRHFIQVLGPGAIRRSLKNVCESICPKGELFIVGHLLEDSRLSPEAAVGQSLVFLTIYEEGQAYTETQYRTWLVEAGFSDIDFEFGTASGGASIVSARKVS